MVSIRMRVAMALVGAVAALSACADETAPELGVSAPADGGLLDSSVGEDAGAGSRPGDDASLPRGPGVCRQARAESLPARLTAMSADAGASMDTPAASTVTVTVSDDLFPTFRTWCGACHTGAAQGSFQVASAGDFQAKVNGKVVARVQSNDDTGPNAVMPPMGNPGYKHYQDRTPDDPIRQFAELVQQWIAAGSPMSFAKPATGGMDSGNSGSAPVIGFLMSPATGNAMTNVGSCIPNKELVATEQTRSAGLDAMFAAAQRASSGTDVERVGLPQVLSGTDLFTLDTRTLAQYGVIAYAPGYPLWSDNAGKLRYIRIPRGKSVHFNKATQQFEFPDNTRFYKTFLKQVVEMDGSIRWKKAETRLIVARANPPNDDDTSSPPALYGAYRWRDDESEADLVTTELRDGAPFKDTIFQYNTNEPLAAAAREANPAAPDQAALTANAARHYAIPSSDRCFACHRGSPSRNFVLGFTPLQIRRRPVGQGGTIEPTGEDELTQLQRLIDYGLITGIDSADDVLPLEASQGSRKPRNNPELVAQGYMLGNCAHCHNPHGDPTIDNPELKNIVNFLPGASGGIFQFPLERFSPRITRGSPPFAIPYITPSLLNLPPSDHSADPFVFNVIVTETGQAQGEGLNSPTPSASGITYAPWRSVLYRNVDSAFSYIDDLALYPHMPMNTPGYDPRAKQIMSDWMVSIPAVRKSPNVGEYDAASDVNSNLHWLDTNPQPYVEVLPSAPQYPAAVAAAQQRLAILHSGVNPAVPTSRIFSRYSDLDDTSDIQDPVVLADPTCHPIPTGDTNFLPYRLPRHPHWVDTDLTNAATWTPRGSAWKAVLVDGQPDPPPPATSCAYALGLSEAHVDEQSAISALPNVTLDDAFRTFATTKVPFGLWDRTGKSCSLTGVPSVRDIPSPQPQWMAGADPSAKVYMQAPGASVFNMICVNCHGPLADGDGRIAQNLATMTGGGARVADFRDGLFGPLDQPGQNLTQEFSKWAGAQPEDAAARYMAWMALGGTKVDIPLNVLTIVSQTKVLGVGRRTTLVGSANMLSAAKQLCLSFLGPNTAETGSDGRQRFAPSGGYAALENRSVIETNGDRELWMQLCTLNNPPYVHRVRQDGGTLYLPLVRDSSGSFGLDPDVPGYFIRPADYQAYLRANPGARVGNEHGDVTLTALTGDNLWPWCVDQGDPQYPACPKLDPTAQPSAQELNAWAVRGAINAGLAVFLYLRDLEQMKAPDPNYDQCDLLP